MLPTSPIIAGIDFSASSSYVVRHALHAASFTGSQVVAVHVVDTGSLAYRAAAGRSKEGQQALIGRSERRLEELAATFPAAAGLRIEARLGRPAEELRRAVVDHSASLLVIAANDSIKKRLGAVAARCVRSAPCDVLVLRDWQEGNFKKIVVCADFSSTSKRTLERGLGIAAAHGARLEIVHVMFPPGLDSWGAVMEHAMDAPDSYATECRDKANRSMEEFLAPHADRLASIDYRAVILEAEGVADALAYHFSDTHADLVILGTRGVSRLEGFFAGTNAERLLHDARVSVLAVRD